VLDIQTKQQFRLVRRQERGTTMKAMILAFVAAVAIAAGAGFVLNSNYQMTADARFATTGAQLRGNEAGYNLVGKTWDGMARPDGAKH